MRSERPRWRLEPVLRMKKALPHRWRFLQRTKLMQRKQLGQKRWHQEQRLTRNCTRRHAQQNCMQLVETFWRTLKWDDDANTEPSRTASEDSFDNRLNDTMLETVNHIHIWSTSAVVSTSHAHGELKVL